ncbi:sel1 repeat family protein [Moraxella catarrhalis]|uniref:tetratricopeptide repeat protein n=1 Tax=Moraxella catarrhalis TaxID=480 RepID=UPI00128E4217|nr:tetratricopeptide repeat protein [Moraxella catarrhalis]MPW62222.1 sel1 repeat family protein [Moraxella catarrhalis]MPX54531.1 sel1 repeat family protein [Moraxella catarrhalis]
MLTKFTALVMGVLLSVSAMAADMATADMATLTRQAQSGDAAAQSNLGVMYDKGHGVRQDYQKAIEWYTKSANQGYAEAQFNLGAMYYNGHGVRQNKSTAKRYFGQACDNGDQSGCDNYRRLNQQGY